MTDWQVGDKAVCVDDGPVNHPAPFRGAPWPFRKGEVVTVVGVRVWLEWGLALFFAELDAFYPEMGWAQDRWRKVLPDIAEPCEAEFVTLLKGGKVVA